MFKDTMDRVTKRISNVYALAITVAIKQASTHKRLLSIELFIDDLFLDYRITPMRHTSLIRRINRRRKELS